MRGLSPSNSKSRQRCWKRWWSPQVIKRSTAVSLLVRPPSLEGKDVLVDGGTDIAKMLQGKAAGVQVQNVSGTFGAVLKIRVRGASSIYGDTKPLWVVDGVVLSDVVDVSPDDLSSGNAATLISSAVAGLNTDDIASLRSSRMPVRPHSMVHVRWMQAIVITTKKVMWHHTRHNYFGRVYTPWAPTLLRLQHPQLCWADGYCIYGAIPQRVSQLCQYGTQSKCGWILCDESPP